MDGLQRNWVFSAVKFSIIELLILCLQLQLITVLITVSVEQSSSWMPFPVSVTKRYYRAQAHVVIAFGLLFFNLVELTMYLQEVRNKDKKKGQEGTSKNKYTLFEHFQLMNPWRSSGSSLTLHISKRRRNITFPTTEMKIKRGGTIDLQDCPSLINF